MKTTTKQSLCFATFSLVASLAVAAAGQTDPPREAVLTYRGDPGKSTWDMESVPASTRLCILLEDLPKGEGSLQQIAADDAAGAGQKEQGEQKELASEAWKKGSKLCVSPKQAGNKYFTFGLVKDRAITRLSDKWIRVTPADPAGAAPAPDGGSPDASDAATTTSTSDGVTEVTDEKTRNC